MNDLNTKKQLSKEIYMPIILPTSFYVYCKFIFYSKYTFNNYYSLYMKELCGTMIMKHVILNNRYTLIKESGI